ncbi:calmodulin-binding receptor-like cytoplasmic kinase 3 [Impatiens glandulifera]|uniref:calmodulin-binding receptor-like cytoplasmic kinase 3 n=1 Tax=Impatiens glandulifera TaxID=253017 RepID=UPI001FB1876B|nr:calmodulin-binding receptor-like cytoplasmic kinase 3 [Impatiens glandulifera]
MGCTWKDLIKMMMMIVALSLFLLVGELQATVSSSLLIHSSVCSIHHISFTDDHNFFFINGELVDKDLFCKTLKYHNANGCFIKNGDRVDCSNWNLSLGRKLLQGGDQDSGKPIFTPKNSVIAASGFLFICCGLLCPCYYRKQKSPEHAVISKDPSSHHSVSSVELNSVSDKRPNSPLRIPPGSPFRVPPGSPFRVPPSPSRFSMSPKLSRIGSVHLNPSQVSKATNNFSKSMIIGEGGFGVVYKAQLQDGLMVAIKRAKKEYFEALSAEFHGEVELLSKIEHRNLVKLLGFVDKGNERLIITEYVPNGTLREHLDGFHGKILDFNQRLEIAIDVAHGLTYLHLYAEKQIIHRDVKSSNILLTEGMRAKVADFGFARLGATDSDRTHISTKVKGTVGYLDPEYMRTYQLTAKSDVYSFGILLIEILTGRRPVEMNRPVEERVTLRWAFKNFERNVLELVDPLMQEKVGRSIVVKMFELAFECAAPTRSDRPDMKTVGEQLWAIRMAYLKNGKSGL